MEGKNLKYIVKMMNGDRHKITEEQLKNLVLGDGLCVLKSGEGIQKSRVENFFPDSMQAEIETKRDMQTGRLHDGTRVRRHFGQWVDDGPLVVDEKGNYVPVRIDSHYYPEVARDCVVSEIEFEKLKELPPAERLQKMLWGSEVRQVAGPNGLEKISFSK